MTDRQINGVFKDGHLKLYSTWTGGRYLKLGTYSKICQETPTHTHTVLKYSGRQVISIELITYICCLHDLFMPDA